MSRDILFDDPQLRIEIAALAIRDSGIQPASHLAEQFLKASKTGSLAVELKPSLFGGSVSVNENLSSFGEVKISTPTSFQLKPIELAPGFVEFRPTILFRKDIFSDPSYTDDEIAGDLVRTLFVWKPADPDLEYSDLLTKVYSFAVQQQGYWLNEQQIKPRLFDPNNPTVERSQLVRGVMGDLDYLADVGFQTWRGACTSLPLTRKYREDAEVLRGLKDDKEVFVQMRELYREDFFFQGLTEEERSFFEQIPVEIRAIQFCRHLVDMTLERIADMNKFDWSAG